MVLVKQDKHTFCFSSNDLDLDPATSQSSRQCPMGHESPAGKKFCGDCGAPLQYGAESAEVITTCIGEVGFDQRPAATPSASTIPLSDESSSADDNDVMKITAIGGRLPFLPALEAGSAKDKMERAARFVCCLDANSVTCNWTSTVTGWAACLGEENQCG